MKNILDDDTYVPNIEGYVPYREHKKSKLIVEIIPEIKEAVWEGLSDVFDEEKEFFEAIRLLNKLIELNPGHSRISITNLSKNILQYYSESFHIQ